MHSAALPADHSGSVDSPPAAEPESVESIGHRLCEALPPLRLQSVSIYDNQCNVLWLSEGALGPDEHALVVEAMEQLGAGGSREGFEQRMEDGPVAVFLPIRAHKAPVTGLVMVLADTKAPREGLLKRIANAAVRGLLSELAVVVRPAAPRPAEHDPTGLLLSLAEDVPASGATSASHPAVRDLTPKAVDQILERGELALELESDAAPAPRANSPASAPSPSPAPQAVQSSPSVSAAPPAVQPSPTTPPAAPVASSPATIPAPASGAGAAAPAATVALELLPFVKLRSGGRMRRFEVLPRGTPRQNRDPAALDVLAVEELLTWMAGHRPDWALEPTCFSINLSIATLEDEQFLRRLGASFSRSGISPDALGFEIAEPLCTQRRAPVERFIGGCERLGCFVVIDGFSFDSAVVPLLRSKAVRLVKIDPRLSTAALRDKLAQALVVAMVQAVKVLGIHCAAQQIESQQVLRWLTAVGCDFGQGSILARALPIAKLQAPAGA